MARVTGLTAARMQEIIDKTIVGAQVDANHNLILTLHDGSTVNAGYVKGQDATALLTIVDSDSINLTLGGSGTPGSPWVLQADALGMANNAMLYGLLPAEYRGGPTKVKINGVLSSERYSWASPYNPTGSRQVRLMKVGSTYVILGQVEHDSAPIELLPPMRMYNEQPSTLHYAPRAKATKLPSGLIILSGLIYGTAIVPTNTVFAKLPAGYRPEWDTIVSVEVQSNSYALEIRTNGDMLLHSPTPSVGAFITLDGISFWAPGVANWTNLGAGGPTFGINFERNTDWDRYGIPAWWEDPYGFLWFRGLARIKVSPTADNDPIIMLPTPLKGQLEQHFRTAAQGVFGIVGTGPASQGKDYGLNWRNGSPSMVGAWVSLYGFCIATSRAVANNPWKSMLLASPWTNITGSYPQASTLLREDGARITRGIISSGTPGANSQAFQLPEPEFWPDYGRLAIPTVSASNRGRLDIIPRTGDNTKNQGLVIPTAGGTAWTSLDQLMWVP